MIANNDVETRLNEYWLSSTFIVVCETTSWEYQLQITCYKLSCSNLGETRNWHLEIIIIMMVCLLVTSTSKCYCSENSLAVGFFFIIFFS